MMVCVSRLPGAVPGPPRKSPLSQIDRSGCPTVTEQRRNLDTVDDPELQGWIEIAHRLFIKVDDATGFERPDIIYFNDGSLIGGFNQGVCGPIVFAIADATERLTQISLDRGGPRDRIIELAGCGFYAARIISGPKGIIHRRRANDGDAHGSRIPLVEPRSYDG